MPAPGDLLAGRYRIVAPLGSGGMATVHRAVDERLERDVAIKVLLPNLAGDPETAARFEREARSLAAASHPSVVAVYDVDPGDPPNGREPFFVMELCAGGSLGSRMAAGRRSAPDELVPILVSVAEGLAELHRRGFVHRDVKPSNILFAADRAKLADFGLALSDKAEGLSDLTSPGTAVGTLAYLAPEVLAGERASAAADVYAVGVIAFLGLTGELPHRAGSMAELVATAQIPTRRVSIAAPWIGTAFDDMVAAALSPNPANRPDALDLASGLTSSLGRWSRDGGPKRWASAMGAAAVAPLATDATDPYSTPPDEATTAAAVPLLETARIAAPSRGQGSTTPQPSRATATRRSSPGWVQPAAWLAALLLIAALVAPQLRGLLGGTGTSPGTSSIVPSAAASASAKPSPSASASPTASPSPSIAPSPTADPALAALDAMNAAIEAARGGPDGLKGKEANDLVAMTADIRQALSAGNRGDALDLARRLNGRIDDLADGMGREQAARLRSASADLVQALGG